MPNLPEELQCIEKAVQLTLGWAQAAGMTLIDVDLVTSALPNKKFSVWLFYATDAELRKNEASGTTQQIKDKYVSCLKDLHCPEDYLEGVMFFVDSYENVNRYAELKPLDY
jgi:hypothetical protein